VQGSPPQIPNCATVGGAGLLSQGWFEEPVRYCAQTEACIHF